MDLTTVWPDQAHAWVDTAGSANQKNAKQRVPVAATSQKPRVLSPLFGAVLVCIATSTRCMQYRVLACNFVLLHAISCCFFPDPRRPRAPPTIQSTHKHIIILPLAKPIPFRFHWNERRNGPPSKLRTYHSTSYVAIVQGRLSQAYFWEDV